MVKNSGLVIYTLRQKFSIIICVKGGKSIWLERIPVDKYLQLFLFHVMVTVETIRTLTDSKLAVIKILNDKR